MATNELTQTSMVRPIKSFQGTPYVMGVVPKNSVGRRVLVYNGCPVVVPRGPGKKVRIG